MSKVGGTYPSVVLGVSEQVPQDRRPGQATEQINMLSDPVHGLVRRRGSVWQDEINLGAGVFDTLRVEAQKMREFSFVIDGREYTLLYRKEASAQPDTKFMYLFDKVASEFIPITYENSTWVDNLVAGGVSAVACVGRYVYLAGNTTIPAATQFNRWQEATNVARMAAWIRAGNFSRTYTLTLVRADTTTLEVSYTTLSSAYPNLLDTSGIEFYELDGVTPRPDYQKDVNDAVNAYNGQVTAWITTSSEDIQPSNIAEELKDALVLAGVSASRVDGTVVVDDADFVDIRISDGGDGTTAIAVGQQVSDPARVTREHYVGKVIRVAPSGGTSKDAYYLEARSDNGETGWTEVTWYETAGIVSTPTNVVSQLIIEDGVAYVAQNGAGLEALAPTSGEHPDYKPSTVGDGVTAPLPNFIGKPITMLTVFQDRLLLGSGGTVNGSRPGDYLNFFRQTALSVLDNDPVEMYAYGSEGDTLRSAVLYDKDLIVFGDLKQYAVSGRTVLSAQSPNISVIAAYEGAAEAHPATSGDYVFYGKAAEERTSMHQLQRGANLTESPTSYEASQQLDQYITGAPLQVLGMTKPNIIAYRTSGQHSTFYVYRYLDEQGGASRLMDAWHKWAYAEDLGSIIGLSLYKGDLLVFTMREQGGNVYVVADKASFNAELDTKPYLDSQRSYSTLTGWHTAATAKLSAAVKASSDYFLMGAAMDDIAPFIEQLPVGIEDHLVVGIPSPALVTPTNPFVRDSNGRPVMAGRLTLNTVLVSVKKSGGMTATVSTLNGEVRTLQFSGRVLGSSSNLIARQPTFTGQLTVGVGRETRECEYTLESEDWQPLQITSIEWTGQHFNRVRRVS